jgi:hypothetical protein
MFTDEIGRVAADFEALAALFEEWKAENRESGFAQRFLPEIERPIITDADSLSRQLAARSLSASNLFRWCRNPNHEDAGNVAQELRSIQLHLAGL